MTLLFDALAPLYEMQRDLGRAFAGGAVRGGFVPPADIRVTQEEVLVALDVPGIAADSLEIELEGDVLTVRGERRPPFGGNGDGAWQRMERGYGRFERTLRVARGLDSDAIEATLADGVLTLRIPKPELLKPKRIEIAAGGTADELTAGDETQTSSEDRQLAGATT